MRGVGCREDSGGNASAISDRETNLLCPGTHVDHIAGRNGPPARGASRRRRRRTDRARGRHVRPKGVAQFVCIVRSQIDFIGTPFQREGHSRSVFDDRTVEVVDRLHDVLFRHVATISRRRGAFRAAVWEFTRRLTRFHRPPPCAARPRFHAGDAARDKVRGRTSSCSRPSHSHPAERRTSEVQEFASAYASRIVAGTRPRSLTVCPFARAHSRTAPRSTSFERRAARGRRADELPRDTERAASTNGAIAE